MAAGGTLIVSGVITATSLEKRDPGTLVLANANAIGDFDTQVNAGIIRATHSQALGDSGNMTVRNRTTLLIETTITSNKRFLIREQAADLEYAYVRTPLTGGPKDTDHNDADFTWQDTGSGLAPPSRLLGSPSPHGSTGTVRRSQIVASLVPNVGSTVRDGRAYSWNIPGGGTLLFPPASSR